MWGLRKQGLKCTDCGTNVHKKCQEHVRDHPNRPLRVLVQYSYSTRTAYPTRLNFLVYSTRTAYPTRLNASYTILVQRDTDTCHVRDWLGRTPLPHGHSYHHRARASRSSLTTRLIVLPACLLLLLLLLLLDSSFRFRICVVWTKQCWRSNLQSLASPHHHCSVQSPRPRRVQAGACQMYPAPPTRVYSCR